MPLTISKQSDNKILLCLISSSFLSRLAVRSSFSHKDCFQCCVGSYHQVQYLWHFLNMLVKQTLLCLISSSFLSRLVVRSSFLHKEFPDVVKDDVEQLRKVLRTSETGQGVLQGPWTPLNPTLLRRYMGQRVHSVKFSAYRRPNNNISPRLFTSCPVVDPGCWLTGSGLWINRIRVGDWPDPEPCLDWNYLYPDGN